MARSTVKSARLALSSGFRRVSENLSALNQRRVHDSPLIRAPSCPASDSRCIFRNRVSLLNRRLAVNHDHPQPQCHPFRVRNVWDRRSTFTVWTLRCNTTYLPTYHVHSLRTTLCMPSYNPLILPSFVICYIICVRLVSQSSCSQSIEHTFNFIT